MTDPHKLSCVKRRESAGAGGSSSEPAGPIADVDEHAIKNVLEVAGTAAAAAPNLEAVAEVELAKAAAEVAQAALEASVAAVTAATAALMAAPAVSKKEKKTKAKLVAKVKAVDTVADEAEEMLKAAWAVLVVALWATM